jgi:LDH2 family malate/lactate/ureidoglycolate dehydrogenase
MLGGLLAGIWRPEVTSSTCQWESNQGAFLTAWDVRCFMKLEQFRAEMDRWIGRARQMQPVVGFDQAELPGGMEAIWSRKSEQSGIALSDEHRQLLEDFAEEAGEAAPFDEYESTRY